MICTIKWFYCVLRDSIMHRMQNEYLYAEMFIEIDPRFEKLANEHLWRFLAMFDNAYARRGGQINSFAHGYERQVAAGSLCREVARILDEDGDSLTWLITETEYFSSTLTSPINILTRSFYKVDHDQDIGGPLLHPN